MVDNNMFACSVKRYVVNFWHFLIAKQKAPVTDVNGAF
jgi:hypothetical protein